MAGIDTVYIDIAIGLAVVFFLLSLAPSALNEAVVFVTRIRSKFLWAYLNQLFTAKGDMPVGTAARDAMLAVRPDATVGEVAETTGKQAAAALPSSSGGVWRLMRASAARDPRPASVSTVGPDDPFVDRLHRQLMPIRVGSSLSRTNKTTMKHVPASSFAQAFLEVVQAADPAQPDAVASRIDELEGTPVYPTLKALWATSENNLARFRNQMEGWFDAEMARLSGLYKRLTRWILAIAAVVVVLAVNVDPIALGRDLWRDPARRASLVEIADAAPETEGGTDTELDALFAQCRDDQAVDTEPTPAQAAEQLESVRTCAIDALEGQRKLGLLNDSVLEWDRFAESWQGGWQWALRPLKLLLVAGAIYLGAPFWYDTLRRLMGIRRADTRRET